MIREFHGSTAVAFVDLLGFKYLMSKRRGLEALREFYEAGRNWLLDREDIKTPGLFVTDCAILWSQSGNESEGFMELLATVGLVSWAAARRGCLPSSSIAYGEYDYDGRVSRGPAEQHLIHGDAYRRAFSDNWERHSLPGVCRILSDDLPGSIRAKLDAPEEGFVIEKAGNDYLYYWMAYSPSDGRRFLEQIEVLESELGERRYGGQVEVLNEALDAAESAELEKILERYVFKQTASNP